MIEYKKRCVSYRIVKDSYNEIATAKVKQSKDVADYARQFFKDSIGIYEQMFMVTMNQANNVVSVTKLSQGGISGTVVDIRFVAKYALEELGVSVILVHNPPSGQLRPSGADHKITQKIKQGLGLLDITLLDHIILTEDSYYSFADDGML